MGLVYEVVYKYPVEHLHYPGVFSIKLPDSATPLRIGLDLSGRVAVWARLPYPPDTTTTSNREFYAAWTGNPVDVKLGKHLGTVTYEGLIWHFFEVGN